MSAGLYIHVPFCRTRCIYCEFYSQTDLNAKSYITSVLKEAAHYSKEWKDFSFDTLYIGGGTPSLLSVEEISLLINKVKDEFSFKEDTEITIECNPDDINNNFASGIAAAGVNRVSVGVQSFNDDTLRFLSRRHDSATAILSVETILKSGIENISIDLIYGIPGMTCEEWKKHLSLAAKLHVKHISAYMLTTHENTVLCDLQKKSKILMPGDDECYRQFLITIESLSDNGFFQYELSNYSVPGFESRHNLKYWNEVPYLGLGPSAHSYIHEKRFSNPPDFELYLKDTDRFIDKRNIEKLDTSTRYNEYVMNSLRTAKGTDTDIIKEKYPLFLVTFNKEVAKLNSEWYFYHDKFLRLTPQGLFVSDYIIEKLFV